MKFAFGKIPINIDIDGPAVGNVYRAKGGRGETKFFLIVSIVGRTCHALGLDREGNIVSTTSYGDHVFAARDVVGRAPDMAALSLNINWEPL